MSLSLRPFTGQAADVARLFAWRNDPMSRAMSLDRRPVVWSDHVAWTRRLLDDGGRRQFIAEEAGAPVGALRLDVDDDHREAVISIVLAPEARGRGLAAPLVGAGLAAAAAVCPRARAVRALIRAENVPSRRAFARAGFQRAAEEPDGVETWRAPLARPLSFTGERPLVVAELSANHGGSLARALETVAAAAEAGADAIKLQTYTPATMTLRSPRDEFRIARGPWAGRTLWDLYEEAHTPWEWHGSLREAADALGLPIFSTPFDATAVDFLEQLGVPAYKIASFELTDLELVGRVAATGKPVIASTGMATLAEIDAAVRALRAGWAAAGHAPPPLALLKCVSAYPAQPRHMNLRAITHLGAAFGAVPGLSDHTLGATVAVAAVALGARIIEKHFTLRRADGGPDSGFSLEPAELRTLTTAVREASEAIGSVAYGPTEGEAENVLFRRSIFFTRDVAAGEPLTRDNVRVIRPGHGLPPAALPLVLGRRATVSCGAGEPLAWDKIG
jgi:pseudaminic acid synthase